MKVLLVGGGITSALTGVYLRMLLPNCHLSVWDKARGFGGRMTTSGCPLVPNCTADIGAQYFTLTNDYIKSSPDVYDDLISEGVLEPLKCKIIKLKPQPQGNNNFVAPNGTGSLVKHFFKKANLNETRFSHHVLSINEINHRWVVETKNGEKDEFDIVILTMPVPQLFLLEGSIAKKIASDENLQSVTYSARFALVLFFKDILYEDWGAKYLDDHRVFRYIAIDNIKRNKPECPCGVVFHTTVGFGQEHVEQSKSDMEPVLLEEAKALFPQWPEPLAVKCHKWRYSQVTQTYPHSSGCQVLSTSPLLIVGGDGFVGSTLDNCVKSSKMIRDNLKQILNI